MYNDRDIKFDIVIRGAILCFQNFEMSAIFKMVAKIRYKKWAVKIQHCPISSKFDMWVDNDVPTLKIFYRSPFSKWPPQYRTNSTLSDFNVI